MAAATTRGAGGRERYVEYIAVAAVVAFVIALLVAYGATMVFGRGGGGGGNLTEVTPSVSFSKYDKYVVDIGDIWGSDAKIYVGELKWSDGTPLILLRVAADQLVNLSDISQIPRFNLIKAFIEVGNETYYANLGEWLSFVPRADSGSAKVGIAVSNEYIHVLIDAIRSGSLDIKVEVRYETKYYK